MNKTMHGNSGGTSLFGTIRKALLALMMSTLLALLPLVGTGCKKDTGKGGGGGQDDKGPIKVGILHSLTGTMAISEKSLRDAELMAIDEINKAGGVLGRQIEAVVEDPQSKFTDVFPEKAKKLLLKDKVAAVFGCWTSVSRQNVLPVFENENGLLLYPVQYEGNECSKNVIYTGAAPNQQIEPAVKWLLDKGYKKFYLLGTNYVFPRTANLIIVKYLEKFGKGAKVVFEEYTAFGHTNYESIVQNIVKEEPDVIFSTINGDSNTNFYKELAAQGISAGDVEKPGADKKKIPVIAVSVGEDELRELNPKEVQGHLAAWNYFQSQTNEKNKEFVKRFQDKYGKERVTDDPIAAAYAQVYLWKLAVEKAKSTDVDKVREAIRGVEFDAPEGKIKVDPKTQHVYKYFRLGKIRDDRQFDVIFETKDWIEPNPYPDFAFPGWRCDWTAGGVKQGTKVDIKTK